MSPENHAWSDLPASTPSPRTFTLEEIRKLNANAVRLCDGYEYRYHSDGRFAFFSMRRDAEIALPDVCILPEDGWWHLPGCGCPACQGSDES